MNFSSTLNKDHAPDHLPVNKILHALKGIQYGSVEITIHNSKIVQIERREKLRFEEGASARAQDQTFLAHKANVT